MEWVTVRKKELKNNLDFHDSRANSRPTAYCRSRPAVGGRVQLVFSSCHVNSAREQRLLIGQQQVMKFTTFNNQGYAWDRENQVWIPPSEKDRLRDRNSVDFCKIKKTTQNGLGHELAYQRASIDRQEVMVARLCQRFMPDQGSSRGGGTDFGPQ
ncbi:hypothetical protein M9H77_30151 [Catharanthus roseus]|uniref:Uncharacterized protein n=1 Tax=Catharanthus roseus TaxID=4058 RepID=A0ACB9ZYF0_CATRO|nr:hypothetical protein M9H77_30151 [Catharanthus roseus]